MSGRAGDKIVEIEKYIEELLEIVPNGFEDYEKDFKIKAACERYFVPEDEESVFNTLFTENVISEELSESLKDAKGTRNFIIHQYEKINDELVFEAITEQLKEDIEEFIKDVEKLVKK